MTLVRQIALISAGCQPWNLNVVDSTGSRFAYAATLVIYIYEWDAESNQFYLHSIMSEHKKTISAIAWNLADKDILGSCSADFKVCIWHVSKRKLLASLTTPHVAPTLIAWFPSDQDTLAYCDGKGPLYLWKYTERNGKDGPVSHPLKEITAVSSNITQISWHKSAAGRLALGHADGTVSFYLQGKKPQTHVKLGGSADAADSVSWLLWDSFSQNYLLICTSTGKLQLIDSSTDSVSIITSYSLPSKAVSIKCAAWLTEAPGAFVTGDAEAGVLRIWTVSKEKPQETFRLKQVGFKALCVLPSDTTPTGTTGKMKFVSRIVCLFYDGGVGVYNLRNSSWDFLKNMGHLETIFDCQFKPDDPDLLATASFDGTIKIWNINTMEAVNSSQGDASIIYSLSWAPGDMNSIAAATSKSGVFIWNIKKGTIHKIEDHEKGKYVYCVSWNQKDTRKIASGGGDGMCMIHQTNGKLIQSFKHPGTVYGCDWNPNNENIIATACEDSQIRVFYVGSGTEQPLKILSGHTEKVFRVKWSPLKDGMLCSTSDDCSVRVWHYAQGIAVRVLEGHTSYTRGLLWCPELPNIIISGSWDSTMRVWDISDGACLDIIEDHGADVYGLACHPERPFIFSSTSRDSTVRLWSMLPLVSSIYLKILISRPLNDIFSPSINQDNGDFNESFGLYGPKSKLLKDFISKSSNKYAIDVLQAVTALFCPPSSTKNLWDLLSVIKDEEVEYSHYKNGICHRKHVVKLTTAKALEKELANVSFYGSGVHSSGKNKNLQTAAEYHLLTGNLKKYCELKIQLGEWIDAIALAPGVSISYWKELTTRWLNSFKEDNNDLVAPFYMATDKADELVKHYVKQNFLEKANVVSIALSEGHLPAQLINMEDGISKEKSNITNYDKLINENIELIAERHMVSRSPVTAACWYLSDSNIQGAVYCLLRGNELELAISLCMCLDIKNSSFKMALTYIAWRCIQKKDWDLAIEILNMCPATELEKACVCINSGLSVMERNDLHKKASLPLVEDCAEYANKKYQDQSSILETVQYYLLSDEPKKGLDIGLWYVKGELSKSNWVLESVWKILQLMSCISSHLLQDISFDRHRFELQTYSAYIGAFIAIRQGFYPIVAPLLSTAISLIRRVHNADLSITEDMVSSDMHTWMAAGSDFRSPEKDSRGYKELMLKISEDPPFGDIGVTFVSGSNLPRHSDHHQCYLRGTAIRGPVYFLEDSKSVISLNDALMWAKVNRFSPLKTGFTVNPF